MNLLIFITLFCDGLSVLSDLLFNFNLLMRFFHALHGRSIFIS